MINEGLKPTYTPFLFGKYFVQHMFKI